jgi:L-arabinokinase
MPIERCAYVAIGPRHDQRIRAETLNYGNDGERCVYEWPLSAFYQGDGQLVTPQRLAEDTSESSWFRHVAGVCLALLDSHEIAHLAGGANILISCDIPERRGLAASAAIQVALAQGLAGLFDAELNPSSLLRVCRSAHSDVLGCCGGFMDHAACLLGEANMLLAARFPADDRAAPVLLPKDIMLAAVDSGPRSAICQSRWQENRCAAHMGRILIESRCGSADCSDGSFAAVNPTDYVAKFRNDLPVKMKGSEFLEQYGQPDGLDAPIDPHHIYKVRSRTEHHIYENDRAHRFNDRLSRLRRTGERDVLVEAGDLMYASHWSYSQRCGLGNLETDVLVTEIRRRGPDRGLYGAKITGMGCGGAVAVLMSRTAGARAALEEACAAFTARTGRPAPILAGSSSGAKSFGCRYLD